MGCSSNEVWGGDDNTQTGAEGARLEDLDKKGKLLLRRRRAETHTGHLYHFLIQFPLARWNTSSRSLPRVETELSLNIQQNSGPLSAGGSKREQNPKYCHEHNCLFRLVRLGDNQTDCTGPCLPRFSSMNQCKWEEKHGQQGGQEKNDYNRATPEGAYERKCSCQGTSRDLGWLKSAGHTRVPWSTPARAKPQCPASCWAGYSRQPGRQLGTEFKFAINQQVLGVHICSSTSKECFMWS